MIELVNDKLTRERLSIPKEAMNADTICPHAQILE